MLLSKVKKDRPITGEYTSLIAMPTPVGWGDTVRPAKTKGGYRPEKGEIRFERLPVHLFLPEPGIPAPAADKVVGEMREDERRPILPLVEQSPDPEPPRPRRAPVPEEILEYRHPGDSDTIRDELFEQMKTLEFRIIAGTIIAIFLGLLELLPRVGVTLPDMFMPDKAPAIYLALNIALGGFCLLLCRNIYVGGFESIKKLRPDGDGMMTISCTAVMLTAVAELVYFLIARKPVHRVCIAPMVLALVINDVGLLVMTRRVARNFGFVALRGLRMAAKLMSDEVCFEEIINADRQRTGSVVYGVRAKFLANYLNFSYEEDLCEQSASRLAPYAAMLAGAAGVIGGIVGFPSGGVWEAFYCLCAVLVAAMPCCRILCLNLPMDIADRKLLTRGAMLNGWAGADEFGSAETLAVGAESLFPRGTVEIKSTKPFGNADMSRTMLYAASLVTAAGGPLGELFRELLEGHREKLLPVEDVQYENEMGVFGYVEDRPVIVGNRNMLRRHGCEMPSKDYESILTKGDRRSIVYVAVSGVTCAVMLVEYNADPSAKRSVQRMVDSGVSLVVCTCDANVTRELVAEAYEIPSRFVTILSTRSGSEYDRMTRTILDKAPAVLATNGRLSALAEAVTTAKTLRPRLVFATILQMICYGLGLFLVALVCCLTGSAGVDPSQIMMLQIICALSALVPCVKRVL